MSDRPPGSAPQDPGQPESLDREGFTAAFRASYRVFWLIAMSVVRDAGLAEDVVQEAAMVGLRKMDQYTFGTNFGAWMGTIVRNLALNQARKERRGRTSPLSPTPAYGGNRANASVRSHESSPAPHDNPEPVASDGSPASEIEPLLRQWLDEVGDVPRACLVLRTLEGLDYAEISRLLQIPEGTAMSHVHRTRRFLRERLSTTMIEDPGKGTG